MQRGALYQFQQWEHPLLYGLCQLPPWPLPARTRRPSLPRLPPAPLALATTTLLALPQPSLHQQRRPLQVLAWAVAVGRLAAARGLPVANAAAIRLRPQVLRPLFEIPS